MKKYFVTATDTDAGKTLVASALVSAMVDLKNNVHVFKPVSAGCEWRNNQWQNEDALLLQAAARNQQTLTQINPIAFEEPIAPHIAAKYHNKTITNVMLNQYYSDVVDNSPEIIVTEGAGGWRLPLGNGQFLSSFVKETKQKVVLVVLMKLGCLNHALLTYQSIIADGLEVVGWVANCPHEMPYLTDNIELLKQQIDAPLIGSLGWESDYISAKSKLNVDLILN